MRIYELLENKIESKGAIGYNSALLENMALFSDSVWVIDPKTEQINVFYDKSNKDAMGCIYTLAEAREIIKRRNHPDEAELLERFSLEYLTNLTKTEAFEDKPFKIGDQWYTLRCVCTPEFDKAGKVARVYVTYANIQPILDSKVQIDKLKEELSGLYDANKLFSEKLEKQSELHYEQIKSILNEIDQQIIITKEDSCELIYCNESALKAFTNGSDEDLQETSCYRVFFGKDKACDECPFAKLEKEAEDGRGELKIGERYFKVAVEKMELNGEIVRLIYMNDITQSKKDLEETNEYLTIVNELANSGMLYKHFNEDGSPAEIIWNNQYRAILGYKDESDFPSTEENFWNSIYTEDIIPVQRTLDAAVENSDSYDFSYRMVRRDGSLCWVQAKGKCMRNPDGTPRLLIGIVKDITESHRTEALIRVVSALAKDYANIFIVKENENMLVRQDEVEGARTVEDEIFPYEEPYDNAWERYVNSFVHPEDRDMVLPSGKIEIIREELRTEEEYTFNYRSVRGGALKFIQAKYLRLDEDRIILGFRDVSEFVKLRESSEMLKRVERDYLTGLYNKEPFYAYAKQMLNENPDSDYDMICLDIDSYSLLNSRYGKDNCDAFVLAYSKALTSSLSSGMLVGRIRDDQFAMLRKHAPFEEHQRYFDEMQSVLSCLGSIPNVKINCGVYELVDRNLSVPSMLNNARLAISGLDNQYGKSLALFDNDTRARLVREQLIKSTADEAIKDNQFAVFYQPKHEAFSEEIVGAEALVRWNHPELGFISPADFIPIFEKNGFITQLDKYVVEVVCQNISEYMLTGNRLFPVSINVSQVDFDQPDIADIMERIVDKYGVPRDLIHFEVTESANAIDIRKKESAILKFKEKGFGIELDDFGAGYSNLSSLGELALDVMKLDRSLIVNMQEYKYRTIVNGILAVAQGLELTVVAEGVETEEQLATLREICSGRVKLVIQGYYYSRPLPRKDFETYIQK